MSPDPVVFLKQGYGPSIEKESRLCVLREGTRYSACSAIQKNVQGVRVRLSPRKRVNCLLSCRSSN
ncbi:hypothetical protein BDZ97DRAFT_1384286 [Flammula alnicola]|nr:hypothetical protein BDZ97DRAFT_1384286 [Flammula alnicola]